MTQTNYSRATEKVADRAVQTLTALGASLASLDDAKASEGYDALVKFWRRQVSDDLRFIRSTMKVSEQTAENIYKFLVGTVLSDLELSILGSHGIDL
jgi:hypothetical protein